MFLAFVELAGRGPATDDGCRRGSSRRSPSFTSRVVQLQFPHFETAKIWAHEESSRHRDATGNAVVFQTAGPFMSVVWEREAGGATVSAPESVEFAGDEMVERA